MNLDPNLIEPSQDFLNDATIGFIFECINTRELDKLPPNPIVRQDSAGHYVAIDGHNLLAVKTFLGETQSVHIAGSATDGLPEISDMDIKRNTELSEKFETCIAERDRVRQRGITSFKDLIELNTTMFNTTGVEI